MIANYANGFDNLDIRAAVGRGLIVTNNPDYFLRMWHDGTGRMMVFGGAGLQLLGAVLLYRVARL